MPIYQHEPHSCLVFKTTISGPTAALVAYLPSNGPLLGDRFTIASATITCKREAIVCLKHLRPARPLASWSGNITYYDLCLRRLRQISVGDLPSVYLTKAYYKLASLMGAPIALNMHKKTNTHTHTPHSNNASPLNICAVYATTQWTQRRRSIFLWSSPTGARLLWLEPRAATSSLCVDQRREERPNAHHGLGTYFSRVEYLSYRDSRGSR